MKIDGININMLVAKGQIESADNNNAGASGKSANGKVEPLAALNRDSSIKEGIKDKQQNRDKQTATAGNGLFDLKAVFALDKEKNVVIRFLDKKGEVVRQYPPEEYISMIKKLKENIENLFSKEV